MARLTDSLSDDRVRTELAGFVSNLTFERVPGEVVKTLKLSVLDTLGVALAATRQGGAAHEAVDLVLQHGGRSESTVWNSDCRVPCPAAAFANGALARALDFDDICDRGPVHVGAMVLPAALAAAESRASPLSGRRLVTALAAGGEILCRCGVAATALEARNEAPPVLYSQLFGYFAATAAAASILDLQATAVESAFGLALTQAAGSMEIVSGQGGGGKALYGAFSGQGGTQSVLLAQRGIDSRCAAFGGNAGLFGYHLGRDLPVDLVLSDLGEKFQLSELGFKPWPCTKVSHPYLEAALAIRDRLPGEAEVDEVILHGGRWGRQFCEPLDRRGYPESPPAAKNSLPYVVAVALTYGRVRIADFDVGALDRREVRDLAGRTRFRYEPDRSTGLGYEAARVELRLKEGIVHTAEVDVPLGDFRRPLSAEALDTKFRDCTADLAGMSLERSARCIQLSHELEELDDVRELAASVSGAST